MRQVSASGNRLLPGTPPGSVGTNGRLGLDDDQDGDYFAVIEEPLIAEEVHLGASAKSTASMAIQAFACEVVSLLDNFVE